MHIKEERVYNKLPVLYYRFLCLDEQIFDLYQSAQLFAHLLQEKVAYLMKQIGTN